MTGIGAIIKVASKVGGRFLGRIAGPLGAVITIAELGYLGLKYSGTLENFKKLYCDKCRSEIPLKYVNQISSALQPGSVFKAACKSCKHSHFVAKIHFLCSNCRPLGKAPVKIPKVSVPTHAKFLFLTCPECSRPLKFAGNKHYKKQMNPPSVSTEKR